MPKIKKSITVSVPKKSKIVKKNITKASRTKKSKSILVDVIEDKINDDYELENNNDTASNSEVEEKKYQLVENRAQSSTNGNKAEQVNTDSLDNQKQFFSKLMLERNESDPLNTKEPKNNVNRRRLGLYQRLVLKFIVLVAILIGAVFYFSFSKLTINLTLRGEAINDSVLLKISDPNYKISSTTKQIFDQNDIKDSVSGSVKEVQDSITKTYPATGESFLGGEDLIGSVKIINNYNKSQALVAKTRILSSDNKLFRIKNAVVVPAGGEVNVEIYADKISEDMAINPTNFTIPGLWLGLQDKIYAKNDHAFVFNKKRKLYITADDIEKASKDIAESLIKKAKDGASSSFGAGNNWLYNTDEPAVVSISAKAGDEFDKFEATASGKIVAISFSKEQISKLISTKLNLIIPDDKELLEFNPDNVSYNLDNYDSSTKIATIKASFSGTMILKKDAAVINPEQIVNLDENQIKSYLKNQTDIKDFELNFNPSFIKKAPSLVDRISIVINKNN